MTSSKQIRIRLKEEAQNFYQKMSSATGLQFSAVLSHVLESVAEKGQIHEVGSRIRYTQSIASTCIDDVHNGIEYKVSFENQFVGILVKSANRTQTFLEVTHTFDPHIWDTCTKYAEVERSLLWKLLYIKDHFFKEGLKQYYLKQNHELGDTLPGNIAKYFPSELADEPNWLYPILIFPDLGIAAQKIPLPMTISSHALLEEDRFLYSIVKLF